MNDTLLAQVFSMSDLVGYQPGSIVSRVLMKSASGNVTLFAFDQGQELTEHTSPFDALVQVLDGEVLIHISKQPFTLKNGEAILMPADQPHALSATQRFKMLLTMVKD